MNVQQLWQKATSRISQNQAIALGIGIIVLIFVLVAAHNATSPKMEDQKSAMTDTPTSTVETAEEDTATSTPDTTETPAPVATQPTRPRVTQPVTEQPAPPIPVVSIVSGNLKADMVNYRQVETNMRGFRFQIDECVARPQLLTVKQGQTLLIDGFSEGTQTITIDGSARVVLNGIDSRLITVNAQPREELTFDCVGPNGVQPNVARIEIQP